MNPAKFESSYSKSTPAHPLAKPRAGSILRTRGLMQAADVFDRVMKGRFIADDASSANRAIARRFDLDESLVREWRTPGGRNNIHLGTVMVLPGDLALEVLSTCSREVLGEMPSGIKHERIVPMLAADLGRVAEAADEALLDGVLDEDERIRLAMLLRKVEVHSALAARDLSRAV